jgi:pentose-5-phosphate-3-epimerase
MGITNIGRQGQLLDEKVFDKVKRFRDWNPEVPVQVDGGVSLKNAHNLVALGVSNIVVGSALSHSANLAEEIKKFEVLQTPFGV